MHPIFIDTEFSGLTQHASLLSIALVPKQGKWFYAVFSDVDTTFLLSEWHQENVVPHLALTPQQLEQLDPGQYLVAGTAEIVSALGHYLAAFDQVIICVDVPAYDWGLFCELFGGALSLPSNIYYIVRDLATLLEAKGYAIDTDRFALAYGNEGANAGDALSLSKDATISSADGREGKEQAPAATTKGILRHNALGDAFACRGCYLKMIPHV